jgi:hypothetical protein
MPIGFIVFLLAFGTVFLALCIFVAMRNKRHPGTIVAKFGNTKFGNTKGSGTFVDEEEEIRKETE